MFAAPVTSVSFQIWDVDAFSNQFKDQISQIQALAVGGATVGPTSVTSAVPGFNTITGTGLSTVVLGTAVLGTASASNTTNQGTIDISFVGPITQFSFEWLNKDPKLGQQAMPLVRSVIYPKCRRDGSPRSSAWGPPVHVRSRDARNSALRKFGFRDQYSRSSR